MLTEDQGYDLSRFKATYFEECAELLAAAEEGIARLRDGSGSEEDLHSVFRSVHSIKGGGGAFGYDALVRFAHVFETALDLLRSGRTRLTPEMADLMVRGNDVLGDYVRAAQAEVDLPADHGKPVMDRLSAIAAAPPDDGPDLGNSDTGGSAGCEPQESQERQWLITLRPAIGLLRTGNDPLLLLRELGGLGHMEVVADRSRLPSLETMDPLGAYLAWTISLSTDKPRSAIEEVFEFVAGDVAEIVIEEIPVEAEAAASLPVPPAPAPAPAPAPPPAPTVADKPAVAAPTQITASIRVDLDKIDRLVDMVGELVITQAMLGQQTDHFAPESHPDLFQGLQALSHHTRELQESVMAIRAQPVKTLFGRAPRLVRDLAAKLGKRARLVMSGESTEVDKTVIERLSEPLLHLLRNCLDHGIETPEERISLGKPAEGTIHLSAQHRSGRIIIEISDDGRGIDRARVLAKAIEKGLVDKGAHLGDDQIDALIFAPGFSTAAAVSDISGRGVGMDVVRKNIQDVGGRVAVQSTPGQGSRFVLSLPLTLAVMDGMLVAVGAERYVLPLTNIVESLRPTAQQARTLVNVGRVLVLRGEYIRLVPLHALLGVRNAITDPTQGLVVVVETEGDERIGLIVDELLGQQQVVIKSLDANFRSVEGISAATILGDGRVALILDVGTLRAMGERLPSAAAVGAGAAA